MPYPHEHSARLRDPGEFTKLWRETANRWRGHTLPAGVSIIIGETKTDGAIHTQSIRFDLNAWTLAQVKEWLGRAGVRDYQLHPATAPGDRRHRSAEQFARNRLAEEHRRRRRADECRVTYHRDREEWRFTADASGDLWVEGMAVPYNVQSSDLGGFVEVIAPGAFDESLADGHDLRVDIEHDERLLLARSSKGSGVFSSKPDGLYVRFRLPNTTLGRDTAENIQNGNLDGLSISFLQGAQTRWDYQGRQQVRVIERATLTGATITAFPAYAATANTVRLVGTPGLTRSRDPEIDLLRRRLDVGEAEMELFPRTFVNGETDLLRRRLQLAEVELDLLPC